jgi:hypothetical protein
VEEWIYCTTGLSGLVICIVITSRWVSHKVGAHCILQFVVVKNCQSPEIGRSYLCKVGGLKLVPESVFIVQIYQFPTSSSTVELARTRDTFGHKLYLLTPNYSWIQ